MVNYVRIDGLRGVEAVDFTTKSLFEFLEVDRQLDIAYGQRTFTAVPATDVIGSRLGVPLNSPLLYLEQITYLTDGTPIEYSDVWVNPDRMQIGAVVHRRAAN
jgi:DNA-binding GntR family transcriptional regulator